jgi:hypothetical protein
VILIETFTGAPFLDDGISNLPIDCVQLFKISIGQPNRPLPIVLLQVSGDEQHHERVDIGEIQQ